MSKLNFIAILIVPGCLGLQCSLTPQTKELPENSTKNNQSNAQTIKQNNMETPTKFELQPMPYAYDALEPFIDKLTVEIHYSKHHQAYYDNFIKAIKGTEIESMDIRDIFRNTAKYPMAVRNKSGGYFNQTFYWESV